MLFDAYKSRLKEESVNHGLIVGLHVYQTVCNHHHQDTRATTGTGKNKVILKVLGFPSVKVPSSHEFA